MMRCGYIDGPDGQLHYREWLPPVQSSPPLVCLHPAPFSGLFFSTALPLLGQQRRVIAPDYPGYGGSCPGSACSEPGIEDYAIAMRQLLAKLLPDTPADLLGFHTGCLVGAAMQLSGDKAVGALVMVDVPYFEGEARAQMLARAGQPLGLGADTDGIAGLWESGVAAKAPLMGLNRAVELLAEQLRVAPRAHLAFRAAFTWPCEALMPSLPGPVAVIATRSALADATRACAAALPGGARMIAADEISRGVFEEGAAGISARVDQALAQLGGEKGE